MKKKLSLILLGLCVIWYASGYRFVLIEWDRVPYALKYKIEYGSNPTAPQHTKIVEGTRTRIFINRRLTNYVRATSISGRGVTGPTSTNLTIKP